MNRGGHHRCRRHIETSSAKRVGDQLSGQAVGWRQSPPLRHQFGKLDAMAARPLAARSGNDVDPLIEKNLAVEISLGERPRDAAQHQLYDALAKFAKFQGCKAYLSRMKDYFGVSVRHILNNRR